MALRKTYKIKDKNNNKKNLKSWLAGLSKFMFWVTHLITKLNVA